MNAADASKDDSAGTPDSDSNLEKPRHELENEQIHQGYDLEEGMLARAHEWVDLFPWLRLLRVLRIAGSPPLLALTAITLSLWFAGKYAILGEVDSDSGQYVVHVAGQLTSILGGPDHGSGYRFAAAIWTLAIWSPLLLCLSRQGALLTAGRTMMSLGQSVSHSLKRLPSCWLAALVPVGCVLPFAAGAVFIGWTSGWLPESKLLSAVIGSIVALMMLPCGLLGFGAFFAVPISWSALVNEPNADPIDSLSRGYEYLFRRPVHLAIYLTISVLLIATVTFLASGVSYVASELTNTLVGATGAPDAVVEASRTILIYLPHVVAVAVAGGLAGGIYLLLRSDAGNQEVEDIWIHSPEGRRELPELPT